MNFRLKKLLPTIIFFLTTLLVGVTHCAAQESNSDTSESWSYHFQYTGTEQYHGGFSASYSGQNSLQDSSESAFSVTATLFLGQRLWRNGEFYFNPEMSGGSGFSNTRGVAGFPNGEVYRVDNPTPKIFAARAFIRQHISLEGSDTEKISSDQNQLAGILPKSRLTLTLGKFSITDIFDNNTYSHDPRTQFMNWSVWASGAWDYAADTRGYNWGLALELHRQGWQINFAYVLVPSTANGPSFDMNLANAYSLNLEIIKSYKVNEQVGRFHIIGFLNNAYMGSYRQAIVAAIFSGKVPDITQTRAYRTKYGFVFSLEHPLTSSIGSFARLSWNDGATETWAYTEIDQSLLLGLSINADFWNRKEDVIGLAYALNGISHDHQDYLAFGGYGFIIGDGHLNYGLENVLEMYYNFKATNSFWLTLDNQLVVNPAYNKDRGPVVDAIAIRGHFEF